MPRQILIEGPINSDTTAIVRRELLSAGSQPIEVRIFSEGGCVVSGFAIHQLFSEYIGAKSCLIDAAFSIASFIASAFTKCSIIENGFLMIHNPSWPEAKTTNEKNFLESLRHKMIKGYASKTKKPEAVIERMMKNETFVDSSQALQIGFVDAILQPTRQPMAISAKYRGVINAKTSGALACNSFGSPSKVLTNHEFGLTKAERLEKLIDDMAWDAVAYQARTKR